jgi:hypothetical protein
VNEHDYPRPGARAADEAVYTHAPDVIYRSFGPTVMVRVASSRGLLRLDGAGAALWTTLQSPRTLTASAESLAEMFEAPGDEVRQDIGRLVEELVELGALQVTRPAP